MHRYVSRPRLRGERWDRGQGMRQSTASGSRSSLIRSSPASSETSSTTSGRLWIISGPRSVPKNRERRGYFPIYFPGVCGTCRCPGRHPAQRRSAASGKPTRVGMKP